MDMKTKAAPASTIYAELRQQRPFDRPGREFAVVLMRSGDVLHHSIDRALAPSGLSHEQYNALRILRGAGEPGLPTLEVAARLVSRSPNITRLLDKLVDKGLARRERSAEDRRQALVRITPEGAECLKKADRAVDAVLARLDRLPAAELRAAVAVLDRARAAVAVATVQEELRSQE